MATKDFITYSPNTGNKNATISVTASKNESSERSTNLKINGKGISKTVSINQKVGISEKVKVVNFNYTGNSGNWDGPTNGTILNLPDMLRIDYFFNQSNSNDNCQITFDIPISNIYLNSVSNDVSVSHMNLNDKGVVTIIFKNADSRSECDFDITFVGLKNSLNIWISMS